MKLIAEWIIDQRLKGYVELTTPKKRKTSVSRKQLMRQYQWQTRLVDINTRARMPQKGIADKCVYTPNWKRKERNARRWGTNMPFNRGAALTVGDWLIMQR